MLRKGTDNQEGERIEKLGGLIACNHQKLKDQTAQCMDVHGFKLGFLSGDHRNNPYQVLHVENGEKIYSPSYMGNIYASAEPARLIQPTWREITEGDGLCQAVLLCQQREIRVAGTREGSAFFSLVPR